VNGVLIGKNKVFALPPIAVAATVLGASVFSVSAFEDMTTEEEEIMLPFFWGFRGSGTRDFSLFKP
jgi:hypothetical protein